MPAEVPPHPGKSFCFTLNNWTQDEFITLMSLPPEEMSFLKFGQERGDRNNVPHLQGYIVFRKTKRLSALKKLLPRASWSNTRSDGAAQRYVAKEGKVITVDYRYGRRSMDDRVTDFGIQIQNPRVPSSDPVVEDLAVRLLPLQVRASQLSLRP